MIRGESQEWGLQDEFYLEHPELHSEALSQNQQINKNTLKNEMKECYKELILLNYTAQLLVFLKIM